MLICKRELGLLTMEIEEPEYELKKICGPENYTDGKFLIMKKGMY